MQRIKLLIGLLVVIFMLGACSPGDAENMPLGEEGLPITGDEGAMVLMQDNSFQPAQTHVAVGGTVIWTNQDGVPHTVTSGVGSTADGVFDSGNIDSGGTFTFTFTDPGTYEYFCSIHPMMTGTVIVE